MQRTQTSQDNSESGTYSCRQAGLDFKNCSKAAAIEEHGVGIQTDQQTSGWESPEMNLHIKDSCFLATAQAMAWKGLLPDTALAAAAAPGGRWARMAALAGQPARGLHLRAAPWRPGSPGLACNKMPCHSAMLSAPPHCHYCLCPALPTP